MKWIKELRVTHYLKNILIFLPAFFGGEFLQGNHLMSMLAAFVCFCMGASAIYLMNDIKDVEKDRMHPVKRKRPLAAGEITIPTAWIVCAALLIFAYGLLLACKMAAGAIIVFSLYVMVNFLYSVMGWKNIPLVDITILISGFYLRILMGAMVTQIFISPWLTLVIITGAGFLAFGKRRNEQKEMGDETRTVLSLYPQDFLDKAMYACMIMSNVFFALWCVLEKTEHYLILFPLLLLICFRYCLDLEQKQNQGDPMDIILNDRVLLVLGMIAGCTMLCLLYVLKV